MSARSEPTSMFVGPSFSSGVFACHQRPMRKPTSKTASRIAAIRRKTPTIGIGSRSCWEFIVLTVQEARRPVRPAPPSRRVPRGMARDCVRERHDLGGGPVSRRGRRTGRRRPGPEAGSRPAAGPPRRPRTHAGPPGSRRRRGGRGAPCRGRPWRASRPTACAGAGGGGRPAAPRGPAGDRGGAGAAVASRRSRPRITRSTPWRASSTTTHERIAPVAVPVAQGQVAVGRRVARLRAEEEVVEGLVAVAEPRRAARRPGASSGSVARAAGARAARPAPGEQRRPRAGAGVDAPLGAQSRDRGLVRRRVVGLAIAPSARRAARRSTARPGRARGARGRRGARSRASPAPLPVVVLDPQDHAPAGRPGDAPDVDRVDEVAEVEVAGRRRGEAGRRARPAAAPGPAGPGRDRAARAGSPRARSAVPLAGGSARHPTARPAGLALAAGSPRAACRFWACWTRRVAAISFR